MCRLRQKKKEVREKMPALFRAEHSKPWSKRIRDGGGEGEGESNSNKGIPPPEPVGPNKSLPANSEGKKKTGKLIRKQRKSLRDCSIKGDP